MFYDGKYMPEYFLFLFREWMEEAGSGLELEFLQKFTDQTLTSTAPEDPWLVWKSGVRLILFGVR